MNALNYPLTQAQEQALIDALRTCRFELQTLVPRLGQPFRKNAQACVDKATAALTGAGEKP